MTRSPRRPKGTNAAHALRVTLTPDISSAHLKALRQEGLSPDEPRQYIDLIQQAGGEKLSVVHPATEDDVDTGAEVAREFTVWLRSDVDVARAFADLKGSALVAKVEPVGFSRAW